MAKIDYSTLDETLQQLIHFVPIIKKLFNEDVSISMSNLDSVILQINSKELPVSDMVGQKLTAQDPMLDVMRKNRTTTLNIPKEAYGHAMIVTIVPITNRQEKVIGSIAVCASVNKRVELIDVAEKFATTSEEIGAATEQLSSSAENLLNYMSEVASAQNNLSLQVENTSKILEMINNVAKNTRILGFNAGIEAARSGEHGKGFSVVAKEITKLADQSADSVNEIRNLLNSMKEKVAEVSKTVNETLQVSETQTSAIIGISNSIQQLTEVAEKIDELAQKI